jgi:MFS family permease
MKPHWSPIIALWLLGVLAAAQFAKMSIIAPVLQGQLHLSLSQLGWLISLLEVGGGAFGFVAGLGLARVGIRRCLLAGLAVLAATSLVEAAATSVAALFAARALEGVGYVLVVIAAPTAIAALAHDESRPRALALWSTFVPVGIAAGAAVTGALLPVVGVRGIMALWALPIMLGGAVIVQMPIGGGARQPVRLPDASAWFATLGFGLYTVFISVVTMLLPSFLIARSGAGLTGAALVAALASLSALPATAAAMLLMRGGAMTARRSKVVSTVALLATVPLILTLYRLDGMGLGLRAVVAIAAVTASGLVPPIMFARLPVQAGATTPDDPRIATANGLITQFGAGGALVGPPLGGLIVAQWGWQAVGTGAACVLLAMLVMIVLAEGLAGRREGSAA